jgi:hypothetical protein
MATVDDARRVKALMEKTRAVMPKLLEDANNTGDFSQIQQAQGVVGRLADLSQKYTTALGSTAQEPAAPAPDAQPEAAPAPDAAPSDQGLNSVDIGQEATPAAPQGGLGSLFPSQEPQSSTEAAAKGATKGAIEAIQKPAMPDWYKSLQDTIDQKPKPGQIDLASLHGMIDQKPAPEADNTDAILEAAQKINSGPKPSLAGLNLDQEYPVNQDALSREQAKNEAFQQDQKGSGTLLEEARQLREGGGEEPAGAGGALRDFPSMDKPAESFDGKIEAIAPKVEQDFKGNPRAVVRDVSKVAQQGNYSPMEQEFLRRVQVELGQRPKDFTITKLLQALVVGAGSIVGAWLTHRYSGQAMLDDKGGEEYDKEKARIGREVYHENMGLNRVDRQQGAQDARQVKVLDNKVATAGANIASKEGIEAAKEGGRNTRLDTKEAGLGARQDKQIAAQEALQKKKAEFQQKVAHWSDSDKQKAIALRQAMNNNFKVAHDILSTPGDAAKARNAMVQIQNQIDELDEANRSTGR